MTVTTKFMMMFLRCVDDDPAIPPFRSTTGSRRCDDLLVCYQSSFMLMLSCTANYGHQLLPDMSFSRRSWALLLELSPMLIMDCCATTRIVYYVDAGCLVSSP